MNNLFVPMSKSERDRFRDAYLQYLKKRDGTPNLSTQRFDVRERFFAEIDAAPTTWEGTPPVDQRIFDRNHDRAVPEQGLDERTLWALATAKTNRAERFGVDYQVAHGDEAPDAASDPKTFILIEEFYHTRILKDVLATIGVQMEIKKPNWTTQALVTAMVRLPDDVSDVLVFCGEIVGVAIFELLLAKARVLFKEQPRALARVEQLFAQIMVDEVGHVHFVRSNLGPVRIALAKRLLPLVAWGVLRDIPELGLLLGRDTVIATALAGQVDAAAASYSDRFVFA